jgi:hypothetical protein
MCGLYFGGFGIHRLLLRGYSLVYILIHGACRLNPRYRLRMGYWSRKTHRSVAPGRWGRLVCRLASNIRKGMSRDTEETTSSRQVGHDHSVLLMNTPSRNLLSPVYVFPGVINSRLHQHHKMIQTNENQATGTRRWVLVRCNPPQQ